MATTRPRGCGGHSRFRLTGRRLLRCCRARRDARPPRSRPPPRVACRASRARGLPVAPARGTTRRRSKRPCARASATTTAVLAGSSRVSKAALASFFAAAHAARRSCPRHARRPVPGDQSRDRHTVLGDRDRRPPPRLLEQLGQVRLRLVGTALHSTSLHGSEPATAVARPSARGAPGPSNLVTSHSTARCRTSRPIWPRRPTSDRMPALSSARSRRASC